MDSSFLKSKAIIFSLLLLIAGCQQTSSLSEAEKLQKIATMYRSYAQEFPEVPEITAEELQKTQQEEIVLVDVRSPEERMISMIPGAISRAEFEAEFKQDINRDRPIVVYCTIGYRSGKYARKLQEKGLRVFNLAGSLLAWSHSGGELRNFAGNTNKIHVFGKQWELTADGYEAIW